MWIMSHQAAELTGDATSCGHIIRTDQCVSWLDLNVVQRDTQYPSSNLGHLEGCKTALNEMIYREFSVATINSTIT